MAQSRNQMTDSVQETTPIESFREEMMLTLLGLFAVVYLLGGVALLAIQPIRETAAFSFTNNYAFSGFMMLFISIIFASLYLINQFGYILKSSLLVLLIFITGSYFLFTNWLLMGLLILLLSIFVGSVLFRLQGSVFVLLSAQILVSAVLTWFAFDSATELSMFKAAASLPWYTLLIQAGIIAFLLYALSTILINSNSQALHVQEELKKQLDLEQKMLEERVYEHTQALDVTQDVNRLISTILDENRLIGDVVEHIKQAFNYYHVQVYLVQPETRRLKIAGATGEAGTALLIGEHYLNWGAGIVGQAAAISQSIYIDDVFDSGEWLANTLLPDTKTEIAVPIIWDGSVLGVLDIQNDQHFDSVENQIAVLETIARQLGTAVSNVNIFKQAEEQLKRESILNEMSLKLQVSPDIKSGMRVIGKHLANALDPISVKVSIDPELLQTEEKVEHA